MSKNYQFHTLEEKEAFNHAVLVILNMILDKKNSLHDDMKEMKEQKIGQNSPGFCYTLGAFDELQYLTDEIKEFFDV